MSNEPSPAPSFREHQEHDGLQDDDSMRVILPVTLALGSMVLTILGLCYCSKVSSPLEEELLN